MQPASAARGATFATAEVDRAPAAQPFGTACKGKRLVGASHPRGLKAKAATPRTLARRSKQPRDGPEEGPIPPERLVFAEKLIAARKAAGLTQVQLADVSGISQSHISHLENATWEPRLATILALCRALRVSPTDLLPNIGKLADG